MNHERALLLAEALESGRYIQGFKVLERHIRNEDGTESVRNCCLGVATRLAQGNGIDLSEEIDSRGVVEFDGEACGMTHRVQSWFGFKTSGGVFDGDGHPGMVDGFASLMGMNDSEEADFNEIARVIRENWESL